MEDRLTGLDSQFLHLEDESTHMHVAGVMLFDGEPPEYEDFVQGIDTRLHLVPRYRQKLAFVPYGQGRPRWVDDPHLNLRYHVRALAAAPDAATLAAPGRGAERARQGAGGDRARGARGVPRAAPDPGERARRARRGGRPRVRGAHPDAATPLHPPHRLAPPLR